MKVKALISFAGQVCGSRGEEIEIPDHSEILNDLLRVGYVEEVKKPQAKKKQTGKG